ncbi:MAG: D-2-hydroxyacid dehydrogenase [Clostridia bacterium]|nr:D-2-hydroxyacid dehydrogenase [Clostridia bacterium]
MKICVLDGYAANPGDISWDEMAKMGELTVYDRTKPEEIIPRCTGADAVLTNKCVIGADVMDALPSLKYIGVLATGYNVIDVTAAGRRKIAVTNIPAYSTESVAQLVFAFILECASHVGAHARAVRAGQWERSADFCFWNEPLTEISGKKLGIIGMGAIGSRVAEIGRAFGMQVTGYSPSKCDKSVLEGIICDSDIISLNCPLKPDNAGMINADAINRMKPGVWLINTARGGLIDEQAVCDALASGKIAYFCADVVSREPILGTNPLLKAPNVLLTPHIAWAPYEARVRLMNTAVNNIRAFINGERLNRVDA